MATAIEGLFNVPTDEAIRQAYLKQQQVSPDVLAQLDAGRQGMALGRMGGAALGSAVGGLLGRQYPEEIRAEQMRKAMSGVTGNTQSERMLSLAQQLQNIPGMEGQAAMAAQKAAEFKAEEDKARVDAMKANAEISKKYEPTKVGVNSQGQVVYSVPNQRGGYSEMIQNVDETGMPGYVANTLPIVGESSLGGTPTMTKVGLTPTGQVVYSQRLSDNTQRQVIARTDANGNQVFVPYNGKVTSEKGVSINLNDNQQDEFAKGRGTNQAQWLADTQKEKQKATTAINTLLAMQEKNDQGIYSGPQAQVLLVASNFLESLGLLSNAQTEKLTRSGSYDKFAKDLVMQDLDGKLGAQVSDADRKYVEARIPQLINNPQARVELIAKMIEINKKKIAYADQMREHANRYNNLNTFEFQYIPQSNGTTTTSGNAKVVNWN